MTAIEMGRPVFAVAYENEPPAGNQILLNRGARPLRSQKELLRVVADLATVEEPTQLALEYELSRRPA